LEGGFVAIGNSSGPFQNREARRTWKHQWLVACDIWGNACIPQISPLDSKAAGSDRKNLKGWGNFIESLEGDLMVKLPSRMNMVVPTDLSLISYLITNSERNSLNGRSEKPLFVPALMLQYPEAH
jgi:hypothetical protein